MRREVNRMFELIGGAIVFGLLMVFFQFLRILLMGGFGEDD